MAKTYFDLTTGQVVTQEGDGTKFVLDKENKKQEKREQPFQILFDQTGFFARFRGDSKKYPLTVCFATEEGEKKLDSINSRQIKELFKRKKFREYAAQSRVFT